MFGLEVVDVAIGLTFAYLLLASITSAIRERIEALLKTRAVDLEQGISQLLGDPDRKLTQQLYDSPMIKGLFVGRYDPTQLQEKQKRYATGSALPSYIPARNFVLALTDVATQAAAGVRKAAGEAPEAPLTIETLRQACAGFGNESVSRALLIAIDSAQGDLVKAQANIEAWFNTGMDRVSGWYRRRSQKIILIVGLLLTVALNVNTLTIIERLSVDNSLRQALVERATQTPVAGETLSGRDALDKLATMRLPVGWESGWPGEPGNPLKAKPDPGTLSWAWAYVLHPLLGWLLTALAVSMGAPFWFDTLNKLTSLRATLKPKEGAAATPPAINVTIMMPPAAAVAEKPKD